MSWNTTDADNVTIDNGVGTVALDGSATITPTVTTTYTLTATSPLGTATSSVTVTVNPAPLPTVDTFSAAPATITAGESATLTWTTTNADSVSINGGASLPADGSSTVSPTTTTTYILTATGLGGTDTSSITVTVNAAPPPPPPPAPANFTLKTFELAGGVLAVEIRDADAAAPVTIDGIGIGDTDGGGRYRGEVAGFFSPSCEVTVQVGASATLATPEGCVPSAPSPPPPPGPNLPPVAAAGATPTSGEAPLSVVFSSAGSADPDGTIATFAWNFGDGTPGSAAANPTHSYDAAGDFTAVLTVTDDAGATATASVAIAATAPPLPPPPPAPPNFTFKTFELAGGVLSVEIRDAEAGAPVTIDGIGRGDTDDGGRYKNDLDGFSSPSCVVTVQIGASSTQATPTGCVPALGGS